MVLPSIFKSEYRNQLEFDEDPSKVFVFTVNFTSYKENIPELWTVLSEEEKRKAKKYCTPYLTDRYIISRGILRSILSFYTKQRPQAIAFIYNKYGKPFLKKHNIQFNISHSHDVVSYIIALNHRVGIDVEFHKDTLDAQALSKLVFTHTESKFFTTLEPKERLKFFYKLWTKKESLIKANGQGLSYPINTIETMTLSSADKVLLANTDNGSAQAFYHFPLEVAQNYSGAIAIEYKINQIVYIETNNAGNICNKIRSQYFS